MRGFLFFCVLFSDGGSGISERRVNNKAVPRGEYRNKIELHLSGVRAFRRRTVPRSG
jgi:hypothetical protein